jgi:hypothetical protein
VEDQDGDVERTASFGESRFHPGSRLGVDKAIALIVDRESGLVEPCGVLERQRAIGVVTRPTEEKELAFFAGIALLVAEAGKAAALRRRQAGVRLLAIRLTPCPSQAHTGDVNDPFDPPGMLPRVGEGERGAPGVAAYQPALVTKVLADRLDILYRLGNRVRSIRGGASTAPLVETMDGSDLVDQAGDRLKVIPEPGAAVTEKQRPTAPGHDGPKPGATGPHRLFGFIHGSFRCHVFVGKC